jgi:ADP-ribosyl-[dinitrogen reductase] hydrolase
MITLKDRIHGGILGLLVGDAAGVPYEFRKPTKIPPFEQIEMKPPSSYDRAHRNVPPGTWSDDGAQALCLLASLLDCEKFDPEDFGRRLVKWYDEGYMAVDGNVFDVGVTTARAIQAMKVGSLAIHAGPSDDYDNGNGSLMRVLPLALWHQGSDAELVHDAHVQSRVTHGHPRSQVCCALYCLWARSVVRATKEPWSAAVKRLRFIYRGDDEREEELEWSVRPDDPPQGAGSGYVVDCLRSARWAVDQGDYETAVKSAISLGNDTDTTACVAAGIAGLRDGASAIPSRWLTALRGKEIVEPLVIQLLGSA